jgi:hypothetical protein
VNTDFHFVPQISPFIPAPSIRHKAFHFIPKSFTVLLNRCNITASDFYSLTFKNKKMKNIMIIGSLVVLGATGIILGLSDYHVADAGDFALGYFSAGQFSAGVFSAGIFSIGIFSAGIFSVGIFSISIFNVGLFALGFFILGWKKKYAKVQMVKEETE